MNNNFKYAFSNESSWDLLIHLLKKPFYTKNQYEYKTYRSLIKSLLKYKNDPTCSYNDYEIYQHIHIFMNHFLYSYKRIVIHDNESYARSVRRANDVTQIYKSIVDTHISPKYLDIGCSLGIITNIITKKLDIKSSYGLDILPYEKVATNFNEKESFYNMIEPTNIIEEGSYYIQVEKQNRILPFTSDSFDLITCIMSLHHIDNYVQYICEIIRCLKPSGILIIQEHNVNTEEQKYMLNILHGLYSISWCRTGHQENPNYCRDTPPHYFSKKELSALLTEKGLKKIKLDKPKHKYESIPWYNSFHNYWSAFQK
jgi:ubiquinone/menaquinone biosynthesis C-methylase UbiE